MKPDSTLDPTIHTFLPSGVAKLEHLGIIRVTGADAASFLQGQLTNDVVLQKLEESRLAAFCNAKGRMQASFIICKRPAVDAAQTTPDIYLICSRDILAPTLKRLSMFVMRAKAKLTDVTDEFSIYGLTGNNINNIAKEAINTPATAIFNTILKDNDTFITLRPSAGQNRALCIMPSTSTHPAGEALATELWHWGEVQAGVATISLPVVEAFVPQMLNYESVGGVNFKKGCYPGQEVVARSQFRGTLKRRAYIVQINVSSNTDSQPIVGNEVFHESDAEQPCGTVVQVAQNPPNYPQTGYSAIVSMQVSAITGGKLTLGSSNGTNITLLPLPYPLLEDI